MKHTLILVVMGVVLVVAACGDTTEDSAANTTEAATTAVEAVQDTTVQTTEDTTAVETTVATTVVQTTEQPSAVETTVGVDVVQVAQDVIAAWNTLDCDAVVDYFAEDGTLEGYSVHDEAVQQDIRFYMALGDNVVIDACEAGPAEDRVACHVVGSDDLSGPVGAVFDADWVFRIADGKVTSWGVGVHDQSKISFVTSMVNWVQQEHPDLFEATFAAPEGWCGMSEFNCYAGKWYSSPEAAAVLLDLGPEFIAQSDRYSVES